MITGRRCRGPIARLPATMRLVHAGTGIFAYVHVTPDYESWDDEKLVDDHRARFV